MLLSEATFNALLRDIEAAIDAKKFIINLINRQLVLANNMDDATAERKAVKLKLDEATKAVEAFEKLLADVIRDWQEEEYRVIGHVV